MLTIRIWLPFASVLVIHVFQPYSLFSNVIPKFYSLQLLFDHSLSLSHFFFHLPLFLNIRILDLCKLHSKFDSQQCFWTADRNPRILISLLLVLLKSYFLIYSIMWKYLSKCVLTLHSYHIHFWSTISITSTSLLKTSYFILLIHFIVLKLISNYLMLSQIDSLQIQESVFRSLQHQY